MKEGLILSDFWSDFGLNFPKNEVWYKSEFGDVESDLTIGNTELGGSGRQDCQYIHQYLNDGQNSHQDGQNINQDAHDNYKDCQGTFKLHSVNIQ